MTEATTEAVKIINCATKDPLVLETLIEFRRENKSIIAMVRKLNKLGYQRTGGQPINKALVRNFISRNKEELVGLGLFKPKNEIKTKIKKPDTIEPAQMTLTAQASEPKDEVTSRMRAATLVMVRQTAALSEVAKSKPTRYRTIEFQNSLGQLGRIALALVKEFST